MGQQMRILWWFPRSLFKRLRLLCEVYVSQKFGPFRVRKSYLSRRWGKEFWLAKYEKAYPIPQSLKYWFPVAMLLVPLHHWRPISTSFPGRYLWHLPCPFGAISRALPPPVTAPREKWLEVSPESLAAFRMKGSLGLKPLWGRVLFGGSKLFKLGGSPPPKKKERTKGMLTLLWTANLEKFWVLALQSTRFAPRTNQDITATNSLNKKSEERPFLSYGHQKLHHLNGWFSLWGDTFINSKRNWVFARRTWVGDSEHRSVYTFPQSNWPPFFLASICPSFLLMRNGRWWMTFMRAIILRSFFPWAGMKFPFRYHHGTIGGGGS